MTVSPTDHAKMRFDYAHRGATLAAQGFDKGTDAASVAHYNEAASIAAIAKGLNDLAVGLRATYMLIEQVEDKIDRIERRLLVP